MDIILIAYKVTHGEKPTSEPRIALWEHGLELFTEGWDACFQWLLEKEEMNEIEKDVLYQQEGLSKGE